MKFSLDTIIIPPEKTDEIKNAVILLHGYGGDGKDISLLTLNWRRFLKNTVFLCPSSHEKCEINPSGFQWFDLSKDEFNCIVGFSGKIINKDNLQARIKNKSKLLLIHGDRDEIVSSNFLLEAKDFFERNKFNIQTKIINNCGHHIPIEASSLALNFIKKNIEF